MMLLLIFALCLTVTVVATTIVFKKQIVKGNKNAGKKKYESAFMKEKGLTLKEGKRNHSKVWERNFYLAMRNYFPPNLRVLFFLVLFSPLVSCAQLNFKFIPVKYQNKQIERGWTVMDSTKNVCGEIYVIKRKIYFKPFIVKFSLSDIIELETFLTKNEVGCWYPKTGWCGETKKLLDSLKMEGITNE